MMEMEEHAEEYEASLKRVQESLQAYPENGAVPSKRKKSKWQMRKL